MNMLFYCKHCNSVLHAEAAAHLHEIMLFVEPCQTCLESFGSTCYDDGLEDGQKAADDQYKENPQNNPDGKQNLGSCLGL